MNFLYSTEQRIHFTRRVLILVNEQGVDRGDESGRAEGASQCKLHLFNYFQLQKYVCIFVWSL